MSKINRKKDAFFFEQESQFDMHKAMERSRTYKVIASQTFLHIRQKAWRWQYTFALLFMIVGYLSPLIDQVEAIYQDDTEFIQKLETLKFYMVWTGMYFNI